MHRKLNSTHLANFVASSSAFAISSLAMQAADLDPVTFPVAMGLLIAVIVIGPDCFHHLSQSSFVFQVKPCEGDGGAGLPVD